MNKLIENYNKALNDIYEHVGFVEDWVIYPIDDCLNSFWQEDGETCKFADSLEQFNSDGDYYEDEIYTQRFYNKHVYKGKDITMIFCNPNVDGMKWFRIFDNKKEVT